MSRPTGRKQRLHRLIDFARVYRGWNRVETARALNRDSTKLYPRTDNPKLDILVGLAGVLDWSIGDIVDYIWNGEDHAAVAAADFEDLDARAADAHRDGRYREMADLARAMYRAAATPEQRARACNREHGAWDGLGRYPKALEAACRGLRESPLPLERQHQLQNNLANTHYTLWELTSAIAHANVVVAWYDDSPPVSINQRKREAFATHVRGQASRRSATRTGGPDIETHLRRAADDLARSASLYEALANELGDGRLSGIAHTARGGLLEVEVELGKGSPSAAVDEIMESLDAVVDPQQAAVGDWLESHGWWCIFGANIALRHLEGRGLQQALAVFTNKALEIAERLDNWALRERVFSMQYDLHEKLVAATGLDLPYVVDDEDRRLITGAMGRFPGFRATGWRIFRAAGVVETNGHN